MLFGLSPKQRKFYQPKDSSKMGGKLFVLDPVIGEYSIERIGNSNNGTAKCFTPDGNEYDEGWLKERLHGIDEKTYRAIFSFSAIDLNKLQDVKEEEISEVLLGIGLTGSTIIYSVEKRLEQQISEYFKPYGKNPAINQQLQTLARLQWEIKVLKEEEAEYREKKISILSIQEEITLLEKTIKEEKERLYLNEKLIQALPQIEEYITLKNQLEELPREIPFPEEGMERLEALKGELVPIETELKLANRNRELYNKEIERLEEINNALHYVEAKRILAKSAEYQDIKKKQLAIREQINQFLDGMKAELANLNIGLKIEHLTNFQLPFHIEKDWIYLRESNASIHREIIQLKQSKQLLQAKLDRVREEISITEISQLTVEKKRELEGILEVHKENQLLEIIQQDQSEKRGKWKQEKQQKRKRINWLLVASLFSGLLIAVLSLFTNQLLLLNISGLSLIIGLMQWIFGMKSIQHMDQMLNHTSTSPFRTISEEERRDAEILLLKHQETLREKELLKDKLLDTEIQLQQLIEKQIVLENQQDELLNSIAIEKRRFPFLEHVDINYWPDLYQSLKGLLDQSKRLGELHIQERDCSKKIDDYHRMLDLYIDKQFPSTNFKSYISKLEFLENEIAAYQERKQQIQQIHNSLQDLENQVQEKTISHELVEDQIFSLFSKANAKDEEEFYKRNSELRKKQDLQESSKRIAAQFSSYFTTDEWSKLVTYPPSRGKVELALNDSIELIKRLENELDQKRQQLANLTVELRSLETSESYSTNLHVLQIEKEKLRKLVRKWTVLKTAKELLSETKHHYRDKYLSKVIQKTTEYFRILTDDGYVQVYSPTAEDPFIVVRNDHTRFQVQELSQGTINQLYTSLRLAISEVMSENFHLPFMIDDAFVHFDVVRNKRMLQILEGISKNHQILFFTCKQDVLEIISDKNLLHLTNCVPLVEN